MVPDGNLRSGRRELRIDGKTGPGGSARRKTKARKRDRKDTVAQELVYPSAVERGSGNSPGWAG